MFDLDFALTLGQETVLPGTPGTGNGGPATVAPGGSTPPVGGAGGGAGAGSQQNPFGPGMFTIVFVVIGAMLLMSIMSSRREKRRREAMINAIKKHDRVQTIGGVIGSVVEIKPDYVVLKVDESSNTRITFARSAVQQVLTSAPAAESPAAA